MKSLIIILLIIAISVVGVLGNNDLGSAVYISTTGSDNNDGSSASQAVATLTRALQLSNNIYFETGSYIGNGFCALNLTGYSSLSLSLATGASDAVLNLTLCTSFIHNPAAGFNLALNDLTITNYGSSQLYRNANGLPMLSFGDNGALTINNCAFKNFNTGFGPLVPAANETYGSFLIGKGLTVTFTDSSFSDSNSNLIILTESSSLSFQNCIFDNVNVYTYSFGLHFDILLFSSSNLTLIHTNFSPENAYPIIWGDETTSIAMTESCFTRSWDAHAPVLTKGLFVGLYTSRTTCSFAGVFLSGPAASGTLTSTASSDFSFGAQVEGGATLYLVGSPSIFGLTLNSGIVECVSPSVLYFQSKLVVGNGNSVVNNCSFILGAGYSEIGPNATLFFDSHFSTSISTLNTSYVNLNIFPSSVVSFSSPSQENIVIGRYDNLELVGAPSRILGGVKIADDGTLVSYIEDPLPPPFFIDSVTFEPGRSSMEISAWSSDIEKQTTLVLFQTNKVYGTPNRVKTDCCSYGSKDFKFVQSGNITSATITIFPTSSYGSRSPVSMEGFVIFGIVFGVIIVASLVGLVVYVVISNRNRTRSQGLIVPNTPSIPELIANDSEDDEASIPLHRGYQRDE